MTAENKKDLIIELDSLFESFDNVKEMEQNGPTDEEQQAFLEKFERIKMDVIKPAMIEIGKYLEAKGHSFQIEDEAGLHIDNPRIKMEIYPKVLGNASIQEPEFPTISFIAAPDILTVGIEVRDGMPKRPGLHRGHMTSLDSISGDYVRQQIVAVLKINFINKAHKGHRSAIT